LESERCETLTAGSRELDLRNQQQTGDWLEEARPDAIFLAAARVGGILANNNYPATFLYDNLMIAANVMEAAHKIGTEKLLFLGSSCIYPRDAPQPMSEDALLSGPLEETNQWYAIAKIAGLKLAQAYRRQYGCDYVSVQPTNLYGPGDNFHPEHSHVPAALLRRFHEAKTSGKDNVVVWGTGRPRREFLYVDDMADACVFVMQHYSGESPLNVGAGEDITIADFAALIAETVGFSGTISFDTSRPDGTPQKLLDISRLEALGWQSRTPLREGLKKFYEVFLEAEAKTATRAAAVG
jgi:GDP-L-fucose synthase